MYPSVVILHGTDDNKGEWSYSPAWLSAEHDKGNSTNSASTDAPTKGSNTRPPGDNLPTPITLPPPVMNTPTSDGQASELHQFQLYL